MDQLSRYNIHSVCFALVWFLQIVEFRTRDLQKLGVRVVTPLLFAEAIGRSVACREMQTLQSSLVGSSEKLNNLWCVSCATPQFKSASAYLESESFLAISYLPISFSFHSCSLF